MHCFVSYEFLVRQQLLEVMLWARRLALCDVDLHLRIAAVFLSSGLAATRTEGSCHVAHTTGGRCLGETMIALLMCR